MPISEFCQIIRGNGIQKKDFVEIGMPCVHYGQIHTVFDTVFDKVQSRISGKLYEKSKKARTGDLIVATTSEDIKGVCKCVMWNGAEEIAVSGDSMIVRHEENPLYLSYYFQSGHFHKQKEMLIHGTKVLRISPDSLGEIVIALPTRCMQDEIVNILNKFRILISDLSMGLPAEISARKKQYEYYRDKLLSFNQVDGGSVA